MLRKLLTTSSTHRFTVALLFCALVFVVAASLGGLLPAVAASLTAAAWCGAGLFAMGVDDARRLELQRSQTSTETAEESARLRAEVTAHTERLITDSERARILIADLPAGHAIRNGQAY